MAKYIQECIDLINDSFKENWEQEFNLHLHPANPDPVTTEYIEWNTTQQEKNKLFVKFISDLLDKIFEKLNCSVLTGEYVGSNDYTQKIAELVDALNQIPTPGTPFPEIQTLINDELKENFVDCIKLAIENYLNIYNQVKLRNEANDKTYIPTIDHDLRRTFGKAKFDEQSSNYLGFFFQNLSLALTDHFLEPSQKDLSDLQEIEFNIDDLPANKLANVLKDKCSFLISKWILRQEELTKEPVIVVVGGKTKALSATSRSCRLLDHWGNYIESHYELGNKVANAKIKSDFNTEKNKHLKDCDLLSLHRRIKFYKDVKKDRNGLDKITKELENRYNNASPTITINDRYVLNIAYLYSLNNEFSFLLCERNAELKKIDSFYRKILQVQNDTGLLNFFAQYKYLDYLVTRLKSTFEERNAFTTVKDAREIIKKCEEIFEVYQHHIEWSEGNFNYVFLLPFKESFIPLQNEILNEIFVASSFALPLSKKHYKKEFEENRRQFHTYKSSIEVFENLEKDIKDTQKRELRSMEIIGIFTAIVTFIATSIPSFKFVETPYQAAIFMLALACSLGLFVLLIIISSRGIHKLNEHWKITAVFFIIAFGSWYSLITWTKDPAATFTVNQKMQKMVDSIAVSSNKKILHLDSIVNSINMNTEQKKVNATPTVVVNHSK